MKERADIITHLIACAKAWDGEARLLGNVTASEVVTALTTLSRLLAESYAPCRECGECPYEIEGEFMCGHPCCLDIRYPNKAAWNLAMRGVG